MGCEFNEVDNSFTLNDGESKECAVPGGSYEIDEVIPEGQIATILCTETTDDTMVDNSTGEISFSFSDAGTPESVDCLFINSFPNLLNLISPEDAGENCENGGIQIQTGEDTNQNNVLDPGEVDDTFFICNGVDGEEGEEGEDGEDGESGEDGQDGNSSNNSLINLSNEPPGNNCENGGIKVETGIDTNGNGVLESSEVADTGFVCNGTDGGLVAGDSGEDDDSDSDGDDCDLFSVVGKNKDAAKTKATTVLFLYSLLPAFVLIRRSFRRRNRDK